MERSQPAPCESDSHTTKDMDARLEAKQRRQVMQGQGAYPAPQARRHEQARRHGWPQPLAQPPPTRRMGGGGRAAPQPGKRRAGRCTTPGSAADDTHIDIRGLSPSLAPAPCRGAPRLDRKAPPAHRRTSIRGVWRFPENSAHQRPRVFPKRCMLVCVNRRRTRFWCALTDAGVRRLLTHTKIVFGVC